MIVEAAPVVSGPRLADRNIASNVEEDNGIYRADRHLEGRSPSLSREALVIPERRPIIRSSSSSR